MWQQIPQQNPDAPARSIDGEAIVITPVDSSLHTLNTTGTFIWDLVDGRRTLAEIATALVASFEVDEQTARADVAAFTQEAQARGLLTMS